MKNKRKFLPAAVLALALTAFLLTACTCAPPLDPDDVDWPFYNARATAFIEATARGDYDEAEEMFDRTMTQLFGASGLRDTWADAVAIAGGFEEIYDLRNSVDGAHIIVGVIMRHENSGFGWNVVFNADGEISGLWSQGVQTLGGLTEITPRDGFTDYPVTVGTAFPLNGILSMPDGAAGVPGIVIVHGSGPNCMDGNIFGNRPYRDIAEYLAANGIAVIRHDKRTLTHPEAAETVWDESIEDALFAAEILRADPRVDDSRVFIIGHSLGGVLAPRIYTYGDFTGLILMAATPRDLAEIIVEQTLASIYSALDEGLIYPEEAAAAMADLDAQMAILTDSYYMQNLAAHPFENYIEKVAAPLLIMQGASDFQVLADVDFILLLEMLAGRENVTFRLYDGLDHLFMQTPAESFVQHATRIVEAPGTVDAHVLRDIVEWINAQPLQ